jgi:regulator of protease activity HflC (stomatin/prohibitin superfamily)
MSMNNANGEGMDTKHRRNASPSGSGSSGHGNVVDHLARHVTDEDYPSTSPRKHTNKIITVQPLKRDEMQQSYAQDLGVDRVEHGVYGTMINALGGCIGLLGAFPCCPLPNPYRNVQQGSVGLVSRFGQFYKAVDPGLVNVNVCSESLRIVDVKIQISPIGRQMVITRDNVNVEIDSVIYFQITNPYRAAFGITDLRQALIERAQTTLRHVVGARAVQSVVTERDAIALEIEEIVSDVADKWGVAIEGILIKDIIFSADVAASLSSAAQQKRIGESKVIAARAEVDAARLMRQAADILASPAAMQIRQLEALQQMAKSAQSKVVFVPMQLQSDVISQLGNQTPGNATRADGLGEGGSNIAPNTPGGPVSAAILSQMGEI